MRLTNAIYFVALHKISFIVQSVRLKIFYSSASYLTSLNLISELQSSLYNIYKYGNQILKTNYSSRRWTSL
jgi:hypothetical protein